MIKNTNVTINSVRPELVEGLLSPMVLHGSPENSSVIPAQAGIHNTVRGLTAHGFRLQATGMTGVVSTRMTGIMSSGMPKRAKVRMTRLGRKLQSGFTLLEMVLVLFLIGLMASATLMLTENVEDQAKYDETKRRMEIMRKAIVGDPTRTVNGGPEISGFVADMGRLPICIAELIESGDETSPPASGSDPKTYDSPCDASEIVAWHVDASTGIGFGWRGPYIQVIPERDRDGDGKPDLRFRDGYGNSSISTTIDAKKSGWFFSPGSNASGAIVSIDVSSAAYDLVDSGDDISNPSLVTGNDWRINTININFINQNTSDALPAAPVQALLRVYIGAKYGDADDSVPLDVSNAIPANSGSTLKTFVFDASTASPTIGQRGYAVVCYDVPIGSTADAYVLFDGDCDNPGNAPPTLTDIKSFTAVPRQNITLDWIIQ
ncbi:MAG: type II secretion system protein [Methylophaga sp.]|nr:type II secretion system protein [Methylophaga sp.]